MPPKLTLIKQNSLYDATGRKSQRHSFQVRRISAVIPLLYNGSCRIGLLGCGFDTFVLNHRSPVQLGGPFGFCAFVVLAPSSAQLSGNRFETYSSSSAFFVFDWRDCMTEDGGCQEEGALVF